MARFRTSFGRLRRSADFAVVRCWLSGDGMHAVNEHRRLANLLRKTTRTPETSALALAVRDGFSRPALTIILLRNLCRLLQLRVPAMVCSDHAGIRSEISVSLERARLPGPRQQLAMQVDRGL